MKKNNWLISLMVASVLVLAGCAQNAEEKSEAELTVPPKDLENYLVKEGENFDFIYEVVNNSGKKLTISNYIYDGKLYDKSKKDDYYHPCPAMTEEVILNAGETQQFKYKLDSLIEKYGKDNVYIRCNFQVEGLNLSHGWSNDLVWSKDKKHTVTVTVENGYMEGENSWRLLNSTNKFVVDEYENVYRDDQLQGMTEERKSELKKNANGQYVYYCYYLSDTPEQYAKYFDTSVYYATEQKYIANMYKIDCKEQLEKLLNNGNFTTSTFNGGCLVLNYNPQLLTKAPDKTIRVVYVAMRTGGVDTLIIYDDNTWIEYITNDYYGDVHYGDGTYTLKSGDETNGEFDITIKNFMTDGFENGLKALDQQATITVKDGVFDFQNGHYVKQ